MTTSRLAIFENKYFFEKPSEVKMWVQDFTHPEEQKEFLKKLAISSQFSMRYRGLIHFYGDDLIAYKRKYPSSDKVNEFLRIFSAFLTDHLEDNCPSSWKECTPAFWEELIYTIFPHYMIVSTKQQETKTFLFQLKKFVRWLDRRSGCSWSKIVGKFADDAYSELKMCEQFLNKIYLISFPQVHRKDWCLAEDIDKIVEKLDACSDSVNSIFQVKSTLNNIITVEDLYTGHSYQVLDFPVKNLPIGILLDGDIGKLQRDFFWSWLDTQGVFPEIAKKYIHFVHE
ncbi:hypothetical protein [Lederbergia panacisoli]|uniref:hypothetical protein n=1 Tax=Lederbergia panacisoli TaxID=1255251 RepID=UPI00214BDE5A|nr:hypothetical protein [Lederbergia panacisoli]MCR2822250.1 hypothetical protein [Lederbergia panacisoli]